MSGPKQTGSEALADAARICERELTNQGLKVIARVWETERAFDLALCVTRGARIVVRCVVQVEPGDYVALKAMLSEGDFDRAALVSKDDIRPQLRDEIETWPLSGIQDLAAALARASASSIPGG